MKTLYAVIVAALMMMVASCAGKSSDSKSAEDTQSTVESADISQPVTSNDSQEKVANQESDEAEDVVMTQMVSNGKPSVIDFSATWCGPCQAMKPIFHKLAAEFSKEYNFITIDIDEQPDLANKYHIQAVPTFIFMDADGEEGDRIKGAVTETDLREMLQNPAWF